MQQNLPMNISPAPKNTQSNLICNKHNLPYEFICPTEKQLYCKLSLQFCYFSEGQECKNLQSSPPAFSFLQAQDLLIHSLETQFDTCQHQSMPKMNYNLNQGLQIIKEAENDLIAIIQKYFQNLSNNFQVMSLSYPCQENQEYLANTIKTMLISVQEWQKTAAKANLTSDQLVNYFNCDYQQKTNEFKTIIQQFSDKSQTANKLPPQVLIEKKVLQNIDSVLSNYVQTYIATGKTMPIEELNIMKAQAESTMIAAFHPPNLIVYDINNAKATTYKQSGNFPTSSSLLVTPMNTIYISGGAFENGILSNIFLQTQDSNKILIQKQNMIVKRAGHSMCYLNKEIYVIGGVTNDNCQTKLCEKYSETSQQWSRIAKLNNPRSRAGLAVNENTNQIYVFFGFASNQTINSIERYDVSSNLWTLIQIKNEFPSQATGANTACYLNSQEILIFGGFAEHKEQILFQNYLLIFNLETNSIIKLNQQIPIDYINSISSPAIAHNEKVFAVGCFSGCKQEMSCLSSIDYLIEINKNMTPKITTLFVSEEQQEKQQEILDDNIQVPKPVEVPSTTPIKNPQEQLKIEKSTQNSPEKQK